jgi:hypothetical protein
LQILKTLKLGIRTKKTLQFRCGNRVWKCEKEIDINAQPLTSCINNGGFSAYLQHKT